MIQDDSMNHHFGTIFITYTVAFVYKLTLGTVWLIYV